MSTTIKEDALKLPRADRIDLMHSLLESLATDPPHDDDLTADQRQELDRRLVAYEANPNDTITWDEIESRVARRHRPET